MIHHRRFSFRRAKRLRTTTIDERLRFSFYCAQLLLLHLFAVILDPALDIGSFRIATAVIIIVQSIMPYTAGQSSKLLLLCGIQW